MVENGHAESVKARNIFLPAKQDAVIREGSLVMLYLSREMTSAVIVKSGESVNTRYGQYKHSDIIGKRYGTKMLSTTENGFCYLLRPTPEIWSLALPHRTQILYMPDISFITSYLDIKPGQKVVEAGTGSGSFSHSLARTVGEKGKVHSFEFHEARCDQARLEFASHGLDGIIQLQHRNVCKDGFGDVEGVDSVFLDLPAPWEAIAHAKKALAADRMTRICCFSPCIEQVIKTVAALQENGFTSITMYETLIRQQEIVRDVLPTVDDAISRLKEIEEKKHKRRLIQVESSRKAREAKLKRKAEEMDGAKEGEAPAKRTREGGDEPVVVEVLSKEPKDVEVPAESAPVAQENGSTAEVATKAPAPAPGNGALKAAPLPERKYSSTKPAVQSRGHTSYLTFAFLIPSKVASPMPSQALPQAQTQEEGSVRDSFASEYSQVRTQDLIEL